MATRSYSSPVREQQKSETHDRILEAVVRVLLDEGVYAFTVKNVATRAHVAHRTVYRHYPTREALIEGVAETLEQRPFPVALEEAFATPDAAEQTIRTVYAGFEETSEWTRAIVVATTALGQELKSRTRRTQSIASAIAIAFPALDASTHRRAGVTLRALGGSRHWHTLVHDMGMTPREAVDAAAWNARTLVEDLARRNAARAKESK